MRLRICAWPSLVKGDSPQGQANLLDFYLSTKKLSKLTPEVKSQPRAETFPQRLKWQGLGGENKGVPVKSQTATEEQKLEHLGGSQSANPKQGSLGEMQTVISRGCLAVVERALGVLKGSQV